MNVGLEELVRIIHSNSAESWTADNEEVFEALFGGGGGRYQAAAKKSVQLRAPKMQGDSGVRFAAYIHPENPTSGAYGGMSFVIFPAEDEPCLVAMVVGTQGLSPDESILGRPGHARKMQAICAWLNREFGGGTQVAWAKQDPTRTDLVVPDRICRMWPEYQSVFKRYGKEIYALYRPNEDTEPTSAAVAAMLDVMFTERGQGFVGKGTADAKETEAKWLRHVLASATRTEVADLLRKRRYVVLQGPPGTGKTRMARDLLKKEYAGNGMSIQFHPNTTYESFVGGLAPVHGKGEFGLQFEPQPGFLMQAVEGALRTPGKPYLLHIDEINRADLAKVLGEAVFLLEPDPEGVREIALPFEFEGFGKTLKLPENLHIVGTMNTADRSIAIVDVAVRRRFAFTSLWPSEEVVERFGCEPGVSAFRELLSIFIEHASEDAFVLVPGHSYFMSRDEAEAVIKLKTELHPLLSEYLSQGYVAGFGESIRSYMQWLESL